MAIIEFKIPARISKALGLPKSTPRTMQLRVLKKLLKKARFTEFGQAYRFDEILLSRHPGRKFQEFVPTFNYNKLYKQWWYKTLEGVPDVCWPGKVKYYALSSGTSESASKYIPITNDILKGNKNVMIKQFFGLRNYEDVPVKSISKGWLTLGGSTQLERYSAGYYAGDLSGITAKKAPFWFQPFYKPGKKIAKEKDWQKKLEEILNSPAALKRLMVKEIEGDAKTFADERRTLIQEEKRTTMEVKIIDEPVTVIVSTKGWVRTQKAHGVDASTLTFKAGDSLLATFECRSIDALIVFGTANEKGVRVYSVAVSLLPGGRGDGQPISSLIELESGTTAQFYFAGKVEDQLLISGTGGYGFYASVAHMISRQKAGKAFVSLGEGETLNAPVLIPAALQTSPTTSQIVCATRDGRLLSFPLSELRQLAGGGRGLMLMDVDSKDILAGAIVAQQGTQILLTGAGRTGKEKSEKLDAKMIAMITAPRGRKGKFLEMGFKVTGLKTL